MKTLKIICLFLLLLLAAPAVPAQTAVSGTVKDEKKAQVPGANVFIKNSYDGTSSDARGNFSFNTSESGAMIIVCSMLGYETVEKPVTISGAALSVDFILKEKISELDVVVISAGTIEASDEKKTTVLKPLDIVTTAGANGDVYGALKTLPGTQQVGESEGLFVRGGTGAETKTVIDGMLVHNPFFSSVPDIAQRGRFSPFLFKGTVFSTGGYSAQYGQGLSSVLVLETQDLPDRTSSTLALSSVGVGAGHNQLWKEKGMSAGFEVNYTNLAPYFALVKQAQEYVRNPQFTGGSVNFRKKTSSTGMLKFYGYFNTGDLALKRHDIDSVDHKSLFDLRNENVYTNLSWREYAGRWRIDLASSYSCNRDRILLDADTISGISQLSQGRAMASRGIGTRSQVRFGGEYQYLTEDGRFNQYTRGFYDNYGAGFVETDIYFSPKLVARAGGRFESSSVLARTNVAPRASLALRTGRHSQASLAYGDFYQKPDRDFLYFPGGIDYEKATHYILNYQVVTDSLTFRVELYHKTYDQLVKTVPVLSNAGDGYARGIDVFWRDKKSFRNVDYWISYTYIDTKRNWRDYPKPVMPTFAADHNASLVFKKFFPKIRTSAGFSYLYSTGRPYYNPNNPEFLGDRTYDLHSLNLNASYLTRIGKAFTVVVLSVTNVPGFSQVYGYRYSSDGLRRETIGPPAKRMIFAGLFMSFGQDRSREVLNNNN